MFRAGSMNKIIVNGKVKCTEKWKFAILAEKEG